MATVKMLFITLSAQFCKLFSEQIVAEMAARQFRDLSRMAQIM
jgi:hypothetical protein